MWLHLVAHLQLLFYSLSEGVTRGAPFTEETNLSPSKTNVYLV